nr:hypothetical protein [Bacteroidota bacterium]
MKFWLIIIIVSLSYCCQNSAEISKYEIFSAYLEDVHEILIAKRQHTYIVIPHLGCGGCMQRVLMYLTDQLVDFKDEVTFISSYSSLIADINFQGYELLVDPKRKVDNLMPEIANITIIKTGQGNLMKIVSLNSVDDAKSFVFEMKNQK